MTVAMYGETATGPTGDNRDLGGGASTSFPPKMETPSARSGDQPEKNEWEPDASDALDRGEAMEANAFARDAANEHPDDRSASAGRAEGGRAQEGGESPISALTTCRAGGSADPATRDASEENEGRIHDTTIAKPREANPRRPPPRRTRGGSRTRRMRMRACAQRRVVLLLGG